jgi:hypothetical protein
MVLMETDTPHPKPFIYLFIYSFIHTYLSESPVKEPSHEMGENIRSPSTESHADGKTTYNAVWPGSPRGSLTTLL